MSSKTRGKQLVRDERSQRSSTSTRRPRLGQVRATTIDVTEGFPSLVAAKGGDTQIRASTPIQGASPAGYKWSKQIPRRRSGSLAMPLQRPKLGKKSATAPPGTLALFTTKPQPPRRAISARLPATPRQSREGRNKRDSIAGRSPLQPRLSQFGTPESRSLIARRRSTIKSPKQRQKSVVWRMLPPQNLKRYEAISGELQKRKESSFSERLRVKETLKAKKVGVLDIDTNIVDFKKRELPDTPSSIINTPRELYGQASSASSEPRSQPLRRRLVSEAIASNWTKQTSQPLTPVAYQHSRTLAIQKQRVRQRHVYVPGPVRLEDSRSAITMTRKGSVATIEPFMGAVEINRRRPSDDAALDELVAFFRSFGIVGEVMDDELDRFWMDVHDVHDVQDGELRESVRNPHPHPRAKASKVLGIGLGPSQPGPSLRSPSAASLPPAPSPRQRIRLRRLLGLPR